MEMCGETLKEVAVTVVVATKEEALNDMGPGSDVRVKRHISTLSGLTNFVGVLLQGRVLSYNSDTM